MSASKTATSTTALLIGKQSATTNSVTRHDKKSMTEAGRRDAATMCELLLGSIPEATAIDQIYEELQRRVFGFVDAGAPPKARTAYLASFHAEVKARYAKFLGV